MILAVCHIVHIYNCYHSPGRSSETVEVVSRNSFNALTVSGVKSSGEVMTPVIVFSNCYQLLLGIETVWRDRIEEL